MLKNWSVFVIFIKSKGNVQNNIIICDKQNVNMLRNKLNYVTRRLNITGSNKSLEIIETPAFYDILDGIEKYRDVLDVSKIITFLNNYVIITLYFK